MIYLYLVYEQRFRYKNYDWFYEVALTEDTVVVRERYIDKDEYRLEFFELLQEYAEKTLSYIQEKHLRTSYPVKIRSGELQKACKEFIDKCRVIHQEKQRQLMPPPVLMQAQQQKVIALIRHKISDDVTVVCNGDTYSPQEFLQQLFAFAMVQVCQHAMMAAEQVCALMGWFSEEFQQCKTPSTECNLTWYSCDEDTVLRWLQGKSGSFSSSLPQITSGGGDFDMIDSLIVGDSSPVERGMKRRK